jgi:hypothetical protein
MRFSQINDDDDDQDDNEDYVRITVMIKRSQMPASGSIGRMLFDKLEQAVKQQQPQPPPPAKDSVWSRMKRAFASFSSSKCEGLKNYPPCWWQQQTGGEGESGAEERVRMTQPQINPTFTLTINK